MSMIHNEQTKLSATLVNGLALIVLGVGGFGPLITALYGSAGVTGLHLVVGVVCFAVAVGLHVLGRLILRGLRP